ncbi:ABC-2 type transport system ATP-binding protein [Clostridium cavendishii DSM 21758]|uniref:ABC-2 type transport system ATP-binding protein n=1 Tax=Clostridium cavendishii DSM 21758 TaxID=1121302 RepID=A0A1M6UX56_9CLOT|nr:ABC transporter ATP-binding protein [Clostridium cavendishii]SHK73741.1 ABC-2 type transport system ATP-binding protein [Clostridium cavendishii DSM 21758]
MNEIILKTENLTKRYKNNNAVNNISLEVKKGSIYGLVGKNGAGKTTILRMICGLTIPTNGEVELFGESSIKGLNNSRRRIGCMIETPSFYPYLSAKKNLEYYRMQRGIVEQECVDEVLDLVGLENVGNKKFKNFSLGMKQRLGLALAIMADPDLLVLDEPINGLDPSGIVELRELLLKLNREKNTTIVISSHILSELEHIATEYGFINNGEFLEQISAKQLSEKCRQYISVKVNDPKKAVTILENNLNSKEYEVLNDNEIRIYDNVNMPEKIAEALVKNEVLLFSLNQSSLKLEEHFMNLVGGNKNA